VKEKEEEEEKEKEEIMGKYGKNNQIKSRAKEQSSKE